MTPPTHYRLELASTGIRHARHEAEHALGQWPIPVTVKDDALLIVGELVTNAVRHARPQRSPGQDESTGPPRVPACSLFLQLTHDHLLITVHDQDPRPPALERPGAEAESGRGLLLVAGLSAAWGYSYPPSATGKSVWAKVLIGPPLDLLAADRSNEDVPRITV